MGNNSQGLMFKTPFGIPQCNPRNSDVENNIDTLERKKVNIYCSSILLYSFSLLLLLLSFTKL